VQFELTITVLKILEFAYKATDSSADDGSGVPVVLYVSVDDI